MTLLSMTFSKYSIILPSNPYIKIEKHSWKIQTLINRLKHLIDLRLQDTLFGVLWKIATLRAQNQSDFHQIFTKC